MELARPTADSAGYIDILSSFVLIGGRWNISYKPFIYIFPEGVFAEACVIQWSGMATEGFQTLEGS